MMIAVITGMTKPLLVLTIMVVSPKHMFLSPRTSQTASKAASLSCRASKGYITIAPTYNRVGQLSQCLTVVK